MAQSIAFTKPRIADCITCHAWNADGTKVALCPNNNQILIYQRTATSYTLEATLSEHDQLVTGIDWGHKTNRIVSCSQDRNAYVWTYDDGEKRWKPVLVILRLNRCATWVRWSPEENKFAVASGAKSVSVCYFEPDNDWWVSKHIKKHNSTVLKVEWHPSNALLATTSTDYKCRIFSAAIKGVDKKPPATPFGTLPAFGEPVAQFDSCLGWVTGLRWSPSGARLAFTGQDSTLCVVDISSPSEVAVVKYRDLPFRDLLFINEDTLVAVGFDCTPVLFKNTGGWKFVKKLDGDAAAGADAPKAVASARAQFQARVDLGQSSANETSLKTKHQNCITCIVPFKKGPSGVAQYSTSGIDGYIHVWPAPN
eukprot:TRINITY_DN3735_c0_g1_i1.p1 TRINITY_DN3735_c0_g1~~TRINITY_DN3735_c0_g1_i1.p1  ORF type:complete len:379 (+),score=110.67 TRINITY_DN3735_c0_g1_i1:40-1137(+)